MIRTRGQSVTVPELSDSAAAFTATVQGAWLALHDNRNDPPVVSPTGDPSVVEYTAHVEAGLGLRVTSTAATPYSGVGAVAPVSPLSPFGPAVALRARRARRTCRTCGPSRACGTAGPAGPLGPRMFHETLRAPFTQTNRFRSPDVARFPFVAGSTHAVMTPLRTPPGGASVLAAAIAATAPKTTTAVAASSLSVVASSTRDPLLIVRGADVHSPGLSQRNWSGSCSGRAFHHDQRLPTRGYASVGLPPPAAASLILVEGSSGFTQSPASSERVITPAACPGRMGSGGAGTRCVNPAKKTRDLQSASVPAGALHAQGPRRTSSV